MKNRDILTKEETTRVSELKRLILNARTVREGAFYKAEFDSIIEEARRRYNYKKEQ